VTSDEAETPLQELMQRLNSFCVQCGDMLEPGVTRCPTCGDEEGEPALDVLEGAAGLRLAYGVNGENMRRLLSSLDDIERGAEPPEAGVAVVEPMLAHFRKWLRQMQNVPPAHVQENLDLANMLRDYIPLCSRLIERFESYRASLSAANMASARLEMRDIEPDMQRLYELHVHYTQLGY
jgi:hypothetical protein